MEKHNVFLPGAIWGFIKILVLYQVNPDEAKKLEEGFGIPHEDVVAYVNDWLDSVKDDITAWIKRNPE